MSDSSLLKYHIILILFITILFGIAQAHSESTNSKIKVACVGNSITYGMKLKDREKESYPSVLQSMLGEEYEVGNFGKNGATLLFKGHRPYISEKEFKEALDFNPDIMVVHLGINDTDPRDFPEYGDFFVKDYVALIDSFKKENPSLRVIIANLSPIHARHYRFKSGTRAWRDSIRNLVPIVANETGADLIDFELALRDEENLIPDGIHPDKNGAKLLAKEVYSAITGDYGGLSLPEIYSDRMVLQRFKPLRIRGKSDFGDIIKLSLGDKRYETFTDINGDWEIVIPPLTEQTGLRLKVTNMKDTLEFKDVAVGEVWLASGQSNMEFKMKNSTTWPDDKEITQDSLLRLFNMKPSAYTDAIEWNSEIKQKVNDLKYFRKSEWNLSDPENSKDFSAVAWYFGKMLRDSLNVPVGIIHNSVGGSPTESWIDIETLEHNMPEILVDWRKNDYLQPWVQQRVTENVGEKNDTINQRHPYEPSYLFSAGVRPLSQYPINGVIWYQGESNAHNIEVHEVLFSSLLESWRNYWGDPELPFIFAQLSSINRPSWTKFRDSQRRLSQKFPNVWMSVTSDIGDFNDVHPKNKKTVGERLGRQALHNVYSMINVVPQGPEIKNAKMTDYNELTLFFDYAEGLITKDGKDPGVFELSVNDGIYELPDSVLIIDDKIVIYTMTPEKPQYVRYGWQPYSESNLINGEGLPASTFKIKIEPDNTEIEPGFESGLSGSFTGTLYGELIIAGGCNFPANPLAPESKKKFYKGIYTLNQTGDNEWFATRVGTIPYELAYGSTVTLPEGVILIGGNDGIKSYSDVSLIGVNKNGEIEINKLPSLPVTIDNADATLWDNKVYLGGGNVNGGPSNRFFRLDLSNKSKGWEELPPFPGNPRVQPVMSGGKSLSGQEYVYIWGGFAGKTGDKDATLNTDGVSFDIHKKKWERIESPVNAIGEEISVGGGASTLLSDGTTIVIGGVNKDIFLAALQNQAPDYLSHPTEWYQFNPNVLRFDPKNETWKVIEVTKETARAGAGVVATKTGDILVVGGEVRPRIRTADIYKLNIE